MKVRAATASDIPRIAEITINSNDEDEMDEYLYPGRKKHPAAYLKAYEKRNIKMMEWPAIRIIVAVTEPSDDRWTGAPKIAGFCIWCRNGESKEVKKKWWNKQTVWQRFSLWLRNTWIAQSMEVIMNPSESLIRYWTYGNGDERYFDPKDKDPEDFWGVCDIIVDKSFQRRGIGQLLLKWGFDHAREEKIPVSLTAAKAGEALYRKVGMRYVGDWKWGPKPEMQAKCFRWDPPEEEDATVDAPATETLALNPSKMGSSPT
ncbi:acyl-CoA N-acyltransferase [Lophium mytilinum]|uniref:Acyl-CoA N-acyltransferase n=1 Tax=Lophium mytilinum TaxID=390894 RepID=A0A6A6QD62_9PEZI|nr:acyl-CoA N-acyltransferase [Lophium mytilinum]